jgi:hypothetical protein
MVAFSEHALAAKTGYPASRFLTGGPGITLNVSPAR